MNVHCIGSKTLWIAALNIPTVFQKHLEEEITQKTLKIKMYIFSASEAFIEIGGTVDGDDEI